MQAEIVMPLTIAGLVVALVVAIGIAVWAIRRNRHPVVVRQRPGDVSKPATTTPAPTPIAAPAPPPKPKPDPESMYLNHLKRDPKCRETEKQDSHEGTNITEITMEMWSAGTTVIIAKECDEKGAVENYETLTPLMFFYDADGEWSLTDGGYSADALVTVGFSLRSQLADLRPVLRNQQAEMDAEGTLIVHGTKYSDFANGLKNLCAAIEAVDQFYTPAIWEAVGPLPYVGEAEGQVHEFSGTGSQKGWVESTRSFTLTAGVLTTFFTSQSDAKVHLTRDKGGWFDEPRSYDKDAGRTLGMFRVAEGWYRDPHPGIGYHYEVEARGDWELTVFQPDLGHSRGQFPHRCGTGGGAEIFGPFRTGPTPILANIQHDGNGEFTLEFISLDGEHEVDYEFAGQTHQIDKELDLLPGKEYLLSGYGNGPWKIELTEGY